MVVEYIEKDAPRLEFGLLMSDSSLWVDYLIVGKILND